ncbi:MAG: TIM barrel protein [Spirochaetes bacterium]|nr:TIM barrel protein [Spirochaetota bacterium]
MKLPNTNIALQLYTMRDHTKTIEDFDKTMARLKEIGYQAIELAGLWEFDDNAMKASLDKHGITVISTHLGLDNLTKSYDRTLARMKTLGFEHAVVAWSAAEYRTADGVKKLCADLEAAGKRLAADGMKLGYHNHKFEFEKFNGKTMLETMYATVDKKYLYPQPDLCWVQNGGMNPIDFINAYKGRFYTVHFKEYTIKADQVTLCELGQGMFNWKAIADAAKKAGARWLVVEQDKCEVDAFQSVKMSYDHLRSLGIK